MIFGSFSHKKYSLKLFIIDNWSGNKLYVTVRRCKMANSGQIPILFVYLLLLKIQTCNTAQSNAAFKLAASGMYSV